MTDTAATPDTTSTVEEPTPVVQPTAVPTMTAKEMLAQFMAAQEAQLAQLMAAVKAEEDAAAAALKAELVKIDAELTELDSQIKPLMDRYMGLKARRQELCPEVAPKAPAATSGTLTGSTLVPGATKKYQTEKYMFWKAYQAAYGKTETVKKYHSQAVLSAICAKNNIPFMPDVATLAKVYDLVTRSMGS